MTSLSALNFSSDQFVRLGGPIQSKWQANFLQVFPQNYKKLPAEHESDKECFEKHYDGEEKLTFEEFKKKHYGQNGKRIR